MSIFYVILAGIVLFAVWRMWRNRHGEIEDRPTPGFDPAEGQPEVPKAVELFNAQDWASLSRLYLQLGPSDRYHLLESLSEVLRTAPPETPADADSALLTVFGGLLMFHGLRIQGSGPAGAVVRKNAPRMMENLQAAARLLRESASRNPHDSTTLALQIRLEHFTTNDAAQINNLVGRIQATDEANIYAASNHLLANAPKWTGSAASMWKVANEWANAGPNAAWLAIPARAHIEEWHYAMAFCAPGSAERAGMIDLMQDENFIRHIARLDDMFWAALPRSAPSGSETSFAHNHLAFLLHPFKVGDRARAHLERIGPHIGRYPWAFLPTGATRPAQLLAELRKQYSLPAS